MKKNFQAVFQGPGRKFQKSRSFPEIPGVVRTLCTNHSTGNDIVNGINHCFSTYPFELFARLAWPT